MAAPKGNQNAAKGARWRDALERALDSYSSGTIAEGRALFAIAKKVVEQAIEGDKDARAEIANRLDGKPTEYRESVVHKTIEHRTVSETDRQIAEMLTDGQDRDTAETLPH